MKAPVLGQLEHGQAAPAEPACGNKQLHGKVDLAGQSFPLAYKYGVFDLDRHAFICFEDGPNRVLRNTIGPDRHTLVNDGFAGLPSNTWRGAGVAIPMFSLRSEKSFGVGEFLDLKPLADWGRQTGLKLIQVLPVNDTTATHTWVDSYPYAAISAFALHPIYLNLDRITAGPNKSLLQALEPERLRLNALDAVDYEAVMKAKSEFIRQILPSQKQATFASEGYKRFFAANRHWLEPYAAFCHLRDKYNTSDFRPMAGLPPVSGGEDRLAEREDSGRGGRHCIQLFHPISPSRSVAGGGGLRARAGPGVEGRHSHRGFPVRRRCLGTAGVVPHGAAGGSAAGRICSQGSELGIPHLQLAADETGWIRMVEAAVRADGMLLRRVPHRSYSRFLPHRSIPADAVEGILGRFVPAIPVEAAELSRQGIEFNPERFTRPYITDPVLLEIFGPESEAVKREFLTADGGGGYVLKAGFSTQRLVEGHFAGMEDNEHNSRIKTGLYELISNVILFEDDSLPGQHYHFRFGMEQTSSFRHLPPGTQAGLKDLYVDYFFRRQEESWRSEGMQKLPALKRVTNMLICGEDLGMVPICVPEVMQQLGLLSLEIQRMPKALHRDFSRPQEAPYLSVVTPSTQT